MGTRVLITLLLLSSCTKDTGCADQDLRARHKDDLCTMVRPGVRGCDGRTRGHERMARRQGIRVVDQGGC